MTRRDWISSGLLHAGALALLSGGALRSTSGTYSSQQIALYFEPPARGVHTGLAKASPASKTHAPPSQSEGSDALNSGLSLAPGVTDPITQRIERKLDYPAELRARGQQGRAELEFEVDANGELLRLLIKRSTGFDRLDQLALQAIRRAAPYPELARFQRAIQLPVEFRIH